MEGLRRLRDLEGSSAQPCSRCGAAGCPWDRIAGRPLCPDCQETLALGEGPPLRQPPGPQPCAICRRVGALPYQTLPLRGPGPVEIDLCGGHLEALLARRLDRPAFQRLEQLLRAAGIDVKQVFLLHEAFYDLHGRSLQPIREVW